jgi:hypothetical protein
MNTYQASTVIVVPLLLWGVDTVVAVGFVAVGVSTSVALRFGAIIYIIFTTLCSGTIYTKCTCEVLPEL